MATDEMAEHDPVERLNTHHAADVLALARAFGGHPEATAAQALAVDDTGLRLAVDSPSGRRLVRVEFAVAAPGLPPGTSRRRAVRAAARRAHDVLDER